MKHKIRLIAFVLAHICLLLSVAYLIFFISSGIRAAKIAKALKDPETADFVSMQDRHLEKAVHENDFSLLSVGQALSEKDDPARDNLLLIADLIIPILALASGITLQLVSVRSKRRSLAHTAHPALHFSAKQITFDEFNTNRRHS